MCVTDEIQRNQITLAVRHFFLFIVTKYLLASVLTVTHDLWQYAILGHIPVKIIIAIALTNKKKDKI